MFDECELSPSSQQNSVEDKALMQYLSSTIKTQDLPNEIKSQIQAI